MLVRRFEQRLKRIQLALGKPGKRLCREGPEDQIDLLEPAPLGAKE
jgi:hypothetical protein